MGYGRDADPSPLKSGIVHAGFSLLVFGGFAAALGAGIQFSGDPADAGPREMLALFESNTDRAPNLKARLRDDSAKMALSAYAEANSPALESASDAPSLGVEYVESGEVLTASAANAGQGAAEGQEVGVRINGKLVRPGESYSDLTKIITLERAPIARVTETVNGVRLPRIGSDGSSPADVYARPFANPRQQPVIALVVGGLGINATHTKSAIEELPPEVTLSFAPDAKRLQFWINRARAAGHETLIEVPMEAYDYGRMKMHPQTILAKNSNEANLQRLDALLGRASGYFGVINYQGAKFADTEAAVRPVLNHLTARGLAIVEDGGLQSDTFNVIADQVRLPYVKANGAIDTKLTADDIKTELMELEAAAKEKGSAMGSGYAFPITIEIARAWTKDLEQKGILLAPVSALTSTTPLNVMEQGRMRTGSLSVGSVETRG